jgi:glycogen synthase
MEFVKLAEKRPIVAHFHEWLTGVGLIRVKQMGVPVATVFTTHATLLGRWLAAGRVDLYNVIHHLNADDEAGRRGIYHKHWVEVGAARGSDIFTTVSDITAYEAEHTLGRKADVVTPNGLNIERFVALHEFQNLHRENKEKIEEFIRGHFYGHLDFQLDKTLYLFTAGRREYYNKGVDLFIESLAELNHMLKADKSETTVVAFIIMPGNTNNYNMESIRGQSIRREIRETTNKIVKKINERLYDSLMRGEVPDPKSLLLQEDVVSLKRRAQVLGTHRALPPIVTHNMVDGDKDGPQFSTLSFHSISVALLFLITEILQHLRRCKLFNAPEDRVKIIYHPEFLNVTSPIFPLDYDDFVRGCHLGVFPSYYEPWGYTPAECLVMGVPSITSNLTGFANFMQRRVPNPDEHGVYIVDRRFKSFEEAKQQQASVLWRFCQLTRRQRIELRNKTERLSYLLDWKQLGRHYYKARKQALKKVYNVDIPMPEFFTKADFDFDKEDSSTYGSSYF